MSRIAYDPDAAAEAVSVSRSTIDAAIRAGDLIARTLTGQPGSKVLIPHTELVAWVEALPVKHTKTS